MKNASCRRTPTPDDATWFVKYVLGASFDPKCCFLTGSVAFGEADAGSDIDIVFPATSKHAVLETLKSRNLRVEEGGYDASVRLDVGLETSHLNFNLMFFAPVQYVIWNKAGNMYRVLPRLRSKLARHSVFELCCATVKTAFTFAAITVTDQNYHEFL